MMDAGYKMAFFPKPKYCVYVSFPFKTALSIYIAIFRVYPKLKDYIFSKGLCAYPAIEIYSSEIEASFTNFWLGSVRAPYPLELKATRPKPSVSLLCFSSLLRLIS